MCASRLHVKDRHALCLPTALQPKLIRGTDDFIVCRIKQTYRAVHKEVYFLSFGDSGERLMLLIDANAHDPSRVETDDKRLDAFPLSDADGTHCSAKRAGQR